MKALSVVPLQAGSAALTDMEEPPVSDRPILVETLAVGICGTYIEILSGAYGWSPPGRERLVLGHESLGRTLEALDEGALNRSMVLENVAVVGSVNANRRPYEAAARALTVADRDWLSRLITRRVPLAKWSDALTRSDDDVKVVIEVQPETAVTR